MIRLRNIALVAALGAATYLGIGAGPIWASADEGKSKILYYRNPMGLADTSPVPKKDSMGMDYVPVYADEEPAASPPVENSKSESGKGKILYYRAPMSSDTSPVPKKDSMGMDYIPVYESEAKESAGGTVKLTPERVQRLGVKSEAVERRDLSHSVHAVGTIQFDEAKQTVIAPRFEGFIGSLAVNTTGQTVKKGDVLLTFYSPQMVQIENEYLVSRVDGAKGDGSLAKLRTLAMPEDEIQRLQREKTVNNNIALRAPVNGTVLEKQAVDGMKFSPGDMLYRLVDLSDVWVIARIYEKDLAQISPGQSITATVSTYPNRTFEGKVAFIYPDIDTETRTAKVRLELPNSDGDLRIAMFANVKIDTPIEKNALSIPASAVLNSGEKQSVLVDLGEGKFRAQPVKIGRHTEEYVQVIDGLKEGDRVVTSASFLIDAESNIRAALQNFSAPEK